METLGLDSLKTLLEKEKASSQQLDQDLSILREYHDAIKLSAVASLVDPQKRKYFQPKQMPEGILKIREMKMKELKQIESDLDLKIEKLRNEIGYSNLEDAYLYQWNGKQCGDRSKLMIEQLKNLEYHGMPLERSDSDKHTPVTATGEGLYSQLNLQNMFLVAHLDRLSLQSEVLEVHQSELDNTLERIDRKLIESQSGGSSSASQRRRTH